jgi:hypothetical protein
MMKIKIILLFTVVLCSCTSLKPNGAVRIKVAGQVEKMGMTTFQYGTHLLKASNKTYALKSSSIKLDKYVGKQIKVTGLKVAGYPVDGGPELIDVTLIEF